MIELIAHLFGDYVLQSDWMASKKTTQSFPALCHSIVYTLPFLFLSQNIEVLLFIAGTHFLIDRFRIARYISWLKNFISPRSSFNNNWTIDSNGLRIRESDVWWHPWKLCSYTGYHPDRPVWLTFWLLIVVDNALHMLCNYIALHHIGRISL